MHFSRLFRVKYIVKQVVEVRKSGTPCFFVSIPTIKYTTLVRIYDNSAMICHVNFTMQVSLNYQVYSNRVTAIHSSYIATRAIMQLV